MLPQSTLLRKFLISPFLVALWCALSSPRALASTWFVSASASAGGDGSLLHPFNSLAAVQKASGPSDLITILPSRPSVPPVDGGIALKIGQKLIGADVLAMGAGPSDPAPR